MNCRHRFVENIRLEGRVYLTCCDCGLGTDVDEEGYDAEQAKLTERMQQRRAEREAAREEWAAKMRSRSSIDCLI